MRFLFVSAQLPGHLDWGGYLATAVTLQRQGHTVLWASGAAVQAAVQAAGVTWQPLTETGWRWPPPPPLAPTATDDAATVRQLRAARALDQWLDVERVGQAVAELEAVAAQFQPDLVVSETFVSAAGLVAERLRAPFVVAGWPALPTTTIGGDATVIALARARLHQLLEHFALTGVNWSATGAPALLSPTLHLTYWSPGWYKGVALLSQTQHVGGRAPSTAPPDLDGDPQVLITLGTSFGNDAHFFLAAAQAADQLGCTPLLALGGQLPAAQRQAVEAQLPASAVVQEQVDFAQLLPRIAVAIHHGGAGTTHALVTHAIPQIVVPHAADQAHQAQGVVRSGVGFHLPAKEVTVDKLVRVLAQLLPDLSRQRMQAQLLQTEFASLGGVKRAADLLVKACGK